MQLYMYICFLFIFWETDSCWELFENKIIKKIKAEN